MLPFTSSLKARKAHASLTFNINYMKKYYALFIFLLSSTSVFAQYKTVVFNYDRTYFNEGQPLPAESNFIVTGEAGNAVEMVELTIYGTQDTSKDPLYRNVWKKRPSGTDINFTLPVNYPLRGNEKYTFLLNFYGAAPAR